MKTRRCAIWGSAVFGMLYSFYAAAQLYTFADIEPKDGRLRGSTALVMLWNVRKDEVRIAKQAIPWVQVFKDSAGERYYTESEGDAVLSVKKSAGKITDVVEMTETNTAYYATHTKLDRDGKFLSRTFCVLESCLTYLERDCREIEKFNQKTVDSCIAEIKKMENYLRDLDDDAHNNAHAESAAAFKAVSKDAKKRGYKYVLPPGIRLSYPLHYRNRGDVWRTTVPKNIRSPCVHVLSNQDD